MRNLKAISALALVFGATSCIQDNSSSLLGSLSKSIMRDSQTAAPNPTNACARGPTLVSLSAITPMSITTNFDGSGVTEIFYQVYNSGGSVVDSNRFSPSVSNNVISFARALTAGNYTLVFKGANCNGQSSLPFTIAPGANPSPSTSPTPAPSASPTPAPSASPTPAPSVSPMPLPSVTPIPGMATCSDGPSLDTDLTSVTNKGLTAQFNGDGINELSWQVLNAVNKSVGSGKFVPKISIFSVIYGELSPGSYTFVIAPTLCNAKKGSILSRTFKIAAVVVTPSPTPTATPTPTPTTPAGPTGMAAALQGIRAIAGTSNCLACHTRGGQSSSFADGNDATMLEILSHVVLGTNTVATKLYIRSQGGEGHSSKGIVTGNGPAWKNAIQAYITARDAAGPVVPGPVVTGPSSTRAGAKKIIRLKNRFSMASFIRDRFTRDNYNGNSSNGAGIALEHIFNEGNSFGGSCLMPYYAEFGNNSVGLNISGANLPSARNYICGDGYSWNQANPMSLPHETTPSVFRELQHIKVCDYLFGIQDYRNNWWKSEDGKKDGSYYKHNPDDAVRMALEPIGVDPNSEPNSSKMQGVWEIFHPGEPIDSPSQAAIFKVGTTMKEKGYSNFEAWRFMVVTSCLSPMWEAR